MQTQRDLLPDSEYRQLGSSGNSLLCTAHTLMLDQVLPSVSPSLSQSPGRPPARSGWPFGIRNSFGRADPNGSA